MGLGRHSIAGQKLMVCWSKRNLIEVQLKFNCFTISKTPMIGN